MRGGGSSNGINNTEATVIDMATDNGGNVYIMAKVESSGFPTISGYSQMIGSYGFEDISLSSYTCNGVFRWKKTIGGYANDRGMAIGTDTLGHVYLTGYAVNPQSQSIQIHFDTDSTQPYSVRKAFFLIQYDTSGLYKWLRQPTPDTVLNTSRQGLYMPKEMIVNKNGEAEILCYLGKGLLGNSNIVIDSLHAYILEYDVLGNISGVIKPDLIFRRVAGDGLAPTNLYSFRITKTKAGKYVLCGTQLFTLFPPYNDPLVMGGQQVNSHLFVAGFNSNWQMEWKKENFQPTGGGFVYRPGIDNDNNIYLSGSAAQGLIFNGYTVNNTLSASGTPFLIKLDASGNLVYGKNASTNAISDGNAVAITNNRVYLTGDFPGIMKWDNFVVENPPNVGYDIFLAGFDKETGAVLSLDSLKGPAGYRDESSVLISDNNNIYLGGELGLSLQVGSSNLQTAGGTTDFFVAKFGNANCATTVVPLTLTKFTAGLQGSQVQCRWQTAQEINTRIFIIERSSDALQFVPAGTIAAAGNSNSIRLYNFDDNLNSSDLQNKFLYYRLQMVDKDGSISYSTVVKIVLEKNNFLQVYPNPAITYAAVSYRFTSGGSSKNSLEVYNMLGIKIYSELLAGNIGTVNLNTAKWPVGLYQVMLRENGVAVQTKKFLVKR